MYFLMQHCFSSRFYSVGRISTVPLMVLHFVTLSQTTPPHHRLAQRVRKPLDPLDQPPHRHQHVPEVVCLTCLPVNSQISVSCLHLAHSETL